MLRLYRELGNLAFLGLVVLWYVMHQTGSRHIVEEAIAVYTQKHPSVGNLLFNAYELSRRTEYMTPALTSTQAHLERPLKRSWDVDLIDAVVRLIGSPYAAQRVTEATLTNLRQALMSPIELAKARSIQVEQVRCAVCRRPFVSGEILTGHIGSGGFSVICHRCQRPSMIACDTCGHPSGLERGLASAHSGSKQISCGCDKRKSAEAPSTPAVAIAPDVVRVRGTRTLDGLAQARPAFGQNFREFVVSDTFETPTAATNPTIFNVGPVPPPNPGDR